MKALVIANWKLYPPTRREALRLARAIAAGTRGTRVAVAIAPPFPYLEAIRTRAPNLTLCAQDSFWEPAGAYTGEVSASMLRDLGVRYCLVGHSERRRLFGEDDATVNRKVRGLLRAGITPVIAIGEGARESREVVPPMIADQLARAIAGIPKPSLRRIVIAYEPVWAISTTPRATPDTPDNATRRAIYIRKLLTKHLGARTANAVRIIYGGSVNAKNAAAFLAADIRGMEGLLVGGASRSAEAFVAIVRAVAALHRGVSRSRSQRGATAATRRMPWAAAG